MQFCKEKTWETHSHQSTPFSSTTTVLKSIKLRINIKSIKIIHPLWEISPLLLVALLGQDICSTEFQALWSNSHNHSSDKRSQRNLWRCTTRLGTLYSHSSTFGDKSGLMRLKRQRLDFRLLLLSDILITISCMWTSTQKSLPWLRKPNVSQELVLIFQRVQRSSYFKKTNSKCTTMNFTSYWENMIELSTRSDQTQNPYWSHIWKILSTNSDQVWLHSHGHPWTSMGTCTMSIKASLSWNNSSLTLTTSWKIVLKITLRPFPRQS